MLQVTALLEKEKVPSPKQCSFRTDSFRSFRKPIEPLQYSRIEKVLSLSQGSIEDRGSIVEAVLEKEKVASPKQPCKDVCFK